MCALAARASGELSLKQTAASAKRQALTTNSASELQAAPEGWVRLRPSSAIAKITQRMPASWPAPLGLPVAARICSALRVDDRRTEPPAGLRRGGERGAGGRAGGGGGGGGG